LEYVQSDTTEAYIWKLTLSHLRKRQEQIGSVNHCLYTIVIVTVHVYCFLNVSPKRTDI